jgi:L-arabinose isomerase
MKKIKPRVGLLTLMFDTYSVFPKLESELTRYVDEITDVVEEFADVEWSGICKTRDQVNDAVKLFESKDLDLILLVFLTYTPSHVALKALKMTKLPILIFNTQKLYDLNADTDADEILRNHGMHGVQDMANVLLRAGVQFGLVTGHYKNEKALVQVKEWCQAAAIVNFLRSCRVGIMGYPQEDTGDFAFDETLLSMLGVEVRHISQNELARMAREAPIEEIREQMKKDHHLFNIAKDITEREHEESSRLEWAIRETLKRNNFVAFTFHFRAISKEGVLQTLPFLASSKMLSEGYGYAGEGDVLASVAVSIMQKITGCAHFTEMFTMDFKENAILMTHMGEGNYALAREDKPVELVGSNLSLTEASFRPVLLRFALKPGIVTLVSLTITTGGKLKIVSTEGKVIDSRPIESVISSQCKFQPEKPLTDFLTELSLEGSSHHFALSYGKWSSLIEKVADLIGAEFVKI